MVSYVGENPGQKTALGLSLPLTTTALALGHGLPIGLVSFGGHRELFLWEKLVTKHPQPRRTAPTLQAGKVAALQGGGKERGSPGISSCLLLPEGKAHACGLGRQGPNPAGFLAPSSRSQRAAQSLEEKVEPQLC